jgi:hypothetical protein
MSSNIYTQVCENLNNTVTLKVVIYSCPVFIDEVKIDALINNETFSIITKQGIKMQFNFKAVLEVRPFSMDAELPTPREIDNEYEIVDTDDKREAHLQIVKDFEDAMSDGKDLIVSIKDRNDVYWYTDELVKPLVMSYDNKYTYLQYLRYRDLEHCLTVVDLIDTYKVVERRPLYASEEEVKTFTNQLEGHIKNRDRINIVLVDGNTQADYLPLAFKDTTNVTLFNYNNNELANVPINHIKQISKVCFAETVTEPSKVERLYNILEQLSKTDKSIIFSFDDVKNGKSYNELVLTEVFIGDGTPEDIFNVDVNGLDINTGIYVRFRLNTVVNITLNNGGVNLFSGFFLKVSNEVYEENIEKLENNIKNNVSSIITDVKKREQLFLRLVNIDLENKLVSGINCHTEKTEARSLNMIAYVSTNSYKQDHPEVEQNKQIEEEKSVQLKAGSKIGERQQLIEMSLTNAIIINKDEKIKMQSTVNNFCINMIAVELRKKNNFENASIQGFIKSTSGSLNDSSIEFFNIFNSQTYTIKLEDILEVKEIGGSKGKELSRLYNEFLNEQKKKEEDTQNLKILIANASSIQSYEEKTRLLNKSLNNDVMLKVVLKNNKILNGRVINNSNNKFLFYAYNHQIQHQTFTIEQVSSVEEIDKINEKKICDTKMNMLKDAKDKKYMVKVSFNNNTYIVGYPLDTSNRINITFEDYSTTKIHNFNLNNVINVEKVNGFFAGTLETNYNKIKLAAQNVSKEEDVKCKVNCDVLRKIQYETDIKMVEELNNAYIISFSYNKKRRLVKIIELRTTFLTGYEYNTLMEAIEDKKYQIKSFTYSQMTHISVNQETDKPLNNSENTKLNIEEVGSNFIVYENNAQIIKELSKAKTIGFMYNKKPRIVNVTELGTTFLTGDCYNSLEESQTQSNYRIKSFTYKEMSFISIHTPRNDPGLTGSLSKIELINKFNETKKSMKRKFAGLTINLRIGEKDKIKCTVHSINNQFMLYTFNNECKTHYFSNRNIIDWSLIGAETNIIFQKKNDIVNMITESYRNKDLVTITTKKGIKFTGTIHTPGKQCSILSKIINDKEIKQYIDTSDIASIIVDKKVESRSDSKTFKYNKIQNVQEKDKIQEFKNIIKNLPSKHTAINIKYDGKIYNDRYVDTYNDDMIITYHKDENFNRFKFSKIQELTIAPKNVEINNFDNIKAGDNCSFMYNDKQRIITINYTDDKHINGVADNEGSVKTFLKNKISNFVKI